MSQPIAVFTDTDDLDPEPGARLLADAGFEVRVAGSRDPDVIAAAADGAVALIVGYARVDAALLDRLPRLRIVATMSAGHDMVDTAEARRRGLWVANLPDAATEDVAVHALASALSLVRRLPQADAVVRAGGWSEEFAAAELPRRASDLTLGLVGLGRIARRFAALAAPVFGRVAAYDPHADPAGWPDGVERHDDLGALAAACDVLSPHVPLTPATRGLVDAGLLARMRPGAFLVNVSRGELVDTEALLDALGSGRLTGAALDVLPVEPPPADDPLRRHPRVQLSPHSAYLSDTSRRAYVCGPAENVVAWHRTGRPLTPVAEPDRAAAAAPATAAATAPTEGAVA
ncbi:C-terminal binding protein [Streptomyces genisteinicus]|uniref:C-terminal binding protein n=1 Tax=Streptomyces genisteinicus TaxID=2768068 RepID=A0A7H0HR77_9ACTN|nr:C-terminal binding protein [Streptomyces genisteinicus]QNP63043.1 C-terminal binding protein [Streptomyces genisteinicus]